MFRAAQNGTLTPPTKQSGGDEPDFVLEIFSAGAFPDAQDRSDEDMQDSVTNESVSLDVKAGQAVSVRV